MCSYYSLFLLAGVFYLQTQQSSIKFFSTAQISSKSIQFLVCLFCLLSLVCVLSSRFQISFIIPLFVQILKHWSQYAEQDQQFRLPPISSTLQLHHVGPAIVSPINTYNTGGVGSIMNCSLQRSTKSDPPQTTGV